ncbi:hypothetical protein [Rhodococcus sp. NPDC003348]
MQFENGGIVRAPTHDRVMVRLDPHDRYFPPEVTARLGRRVLAEINAESSSVER